MDCSENVLLVLLHNDARRQAPFRRKLDLGEWRSHRHWSTQLEARIDDQRRQHEERQPQAHG